MPRLFQKGHIFLDACLNIDFNGEIAFQSEFISLATTTRRWCNIVKTPPGQWWPYRLGALNYPMIQTYNREMYRIQSNSYWLAYGWSYKLWNISWFALFAAAFVNCIDKAQTNNPEAWLSETVQIVCSFFFLFGGHQKFSFCNIQLTSK